MEGTMLYFILGSVLTIILGLIGVVYSTLADRQNKHDAKIQEIEVLINGKYQLKDEAVAAQEKLFNKLDAIQSTVTSGHAKLQHDISTSHMELQKDINSSHTELQKDINTSYTELQKDINSCKAEHHTRRRGDERSEGD